MAKVNINERSWAIDLISEINKYIVNKQIKIQHAGGESTLKNTSGSLFPDVLLFGDSNKGDILQGWELKMPDTSINDVEFFNNAKKKADLLKLDSFLFLKYISVLIATTKTRSRTTGFILNQNSVIKWLTTKASLI